MKKLFFLLTFLLASNIHSQNISEIKPLYKVGKIVLDELPEKLYVSGVELSKIGAEMILFKPDAKMIGSEQFFTGTVAWGQGKKTNKNYTLFGDFLSISPIENKDNRVKSSIIGHINLLAKHGWKYKEKVEFYNQGYILFTKSK